MNNLMQSQHYALALTLAGAVLLSACGKDPAVDPESSAPGAPAAGTQAAAASIGLAPRLDPNIVPPVGNGQAKCNIETLAGQLLEAPPPVISKASAASLVGWYVDVAGKNTGHGLKLVIHNQDHSKNWVVPVSERTDRKDVADSIDGSAEYVKSGFSFALDFRSFPSGYYGAYLTDNLASAGVCALGRTFGLE